ncbi:type II toxin-antitoxin system PemK/MazF family toxin [Gorillibacterium sp. sgz500922]|uniref:type II toxin-antitoxin system PemK/MazF family toxin n=1 Tax=Gorillibacterium sp. sgz500922 TaxID=3446694 RepID=UPI003F670C3C
MTILNRGDFGWLDFDPQAGYEQAGRRPAIVLSDSQFNAATGFAVVCPITSQEKGYPFEVKLPADLPIQGVVLTDQFKSLDFQVRRFKVAGNLPRESDAMRLIMRNVRAILA